ncbi:MAG: hypothetical protein JKY51_04980, partial [Opitutaceae bacterium]|nr:hypothetical protein [Opitutaceae bacterium]
MSTLAVFSQTVSDLIPARKPAPPAAADRPEFDRQLEDAGERFDKSGPVAEKTQVTKPTDERAEAKTVDTSVDRDTQ